MALWSRMKTRTIWKREPARIAYVVQCVIALLVAFGVHLSGEQVAAIMALTSALLGEAYVRRNVTPWPTDIDPPAPPK